jgi:hypothetical protein
MVILFLDLAATKNITVAAVLYEQGVEILKTTTCMFHYCKHTFISIFPGFVKTFSFPATQLRASVTVLELFYSSLSKNS